MGILSPLFLLRVDAFDGLTDGSDSKQYVKRSQTA
ncbi:hypothetical protein COPEUT_00871 [Coprococcus eutactus ATCC 27759]|nr:hypothetical protein COPEUT_00871 [Coprococcus eutactus ATCC 27759]